MQKKFSGKSEKANGLMQVIKRRAQINQQNITHIANYLFDHPGAQVADIAKHLCNMNGEWGGGPERRYSQYFNPSQRRPGARRQYVNHLWCETPDGTGWMLTIEGYGRVNKSSTKEKTLDP